MTALSRVWVCGRSRAEIVVSNPAGNMDVCFFRVLRVVSATGLSLVQRSPTESVVSECGREASIMRKPYPTGGCGATQKRKLI